MAVPTRTQRPIRRLLQTLVRAEGGTQLLEYGLLSLAIGLAGLVAFSTFSTKMTAAYNGWNVGTQAIWEPCPPQPAACP